MGTISAELTKFKSSVDGHLGDMSNNCNDLVTNLKKVSNDSSNFRNQLSTYYKSANSATVLATFDSSKEGFLKISTSLSDNLSPIISGASELIEKITELEDINKKIEEQETIVRNNSGDTDEEKSKRNSANSEINTLNEKFDKLHDEAKNKLNELKSKDATIDISDIIKANSAEVDGIKVEGGTLQPASYTAKNGIVVNYYIYIPNVVEQTTEKLPMLLYFHGIQDTIDKNTKNGNKYGGGLAGLIQKGVIEPKGICIFPQATGGTPDQAFVNKNYEEAVLELTDRVAETYNGDTNRLSVAGHSNGGAAVVHIVNNFPGKFSACAPICCPANTKEGMLKTNIYAFAGQNDDPKNKGCTGMAVHVRNAGGIGLARTYYGRGHDIQTSVFEDDQVDENGNKVKLIDWLMSQTLRS